MSATRVQSGRRPYRAQTRRRRPTWLVGALCWGFAALVAVADALGLVK